MVRASGHEEIVDDDGGFMASVFTRTAGDDESRLEMGARIDGAEGPSAMGVTRVGMFVCSSLPSPPISTLGLIPIPNTNQPHYPQRIPRARRDSGSSESHH